MSKIESNVCLVFAHVRRYVIGKSHATNFPIDCGNTIMGFFINISFTFV